MTAVDGLKTILASELPKQIKLKTNITELDTTFGGGLPMNGVIELCGESGSGKTQLCLQLSLTAQLDEVDHGLGGSVIYICTEDVFPSQRLQQLLKTFESDVGSGDLGSNIFIEHVPDYEKLKDCLTLKVPRLLVRQSVKLLIIDSVAALFRGTYNTTEGNSRTQDLRALGGLLLKLHFVHKICVICVNQVAACFSTNKTIAALGLAWSNIVTTRIQLYRHHGSKRSLDVLFSPNLKQHKIYFEITERGLSSV